jgi:glutathione synthase/RimK-type ligase-like ATP-grasp enzyme
VTAALERRGHVVVEFDTRRFPVDARMALPHAAEAGGHLLLPTGAVDLGALRSVWVRHVSVAAELGDAVAPDWHPMVQAQSRRAFWDLLDALPCRMVDRPAALAAGTDAVGQLRRAVVAGLAVPRTLVTNDPAAARRFLDLVEGPVVRKLINSSAEPLPGHDDRYPQARRLSAADQASLDRLALCPMVLQEEVPRARELRVTVIGPQVFAVASPAPGPADALDWGSDPSRIQAMQPVSLDPEARDSVLRMLDRLGLQFATVDLLERPDGELVFLEFNTISYFGFVEEITGLPLAQAMADLLDGTVPLRQPAG